MYVNKYKHLALSLVGGVLLVVAFLLLPNVHSHIGRAASTDFFVTTSGSGTACSQSNPCNLQTALSNANDSDAVFLASGTYTSTSSPVIHITKSINFYGGWDGSSSGSVVRDPETYISKLDGEDNHQVVYITGDITPTLDGLWMTHGSAISGGGIYAPDAHPVIKDCMISKNSAKAGGGIALYGSDNSRLISNQVYSNTATSGVGGGIYIYDSDNTTLTSNIVYSNTAPIAGGVYISIGINDFLSNNQIYNNSAIDTWSGYGGGIFLSSNTNTILNKNQVWNNTAAKFGGGVYIYRADGIVLSGNQFSGNNAISGGGMYLTYNDGLLTASLTGNTISNNSTTSLGGGLYLYGSITTSITLTNNIVADNQGGGSGAGMYIKGFTPYLLHTTIARNTGIDGSGIALSSGGVVLTNTILVSQTIGINVANDSTATLEATLWGSGAWANGSDWGGTGTILTGAINVRGDPAFVDPDNGDYHISKNSAAIDAGVNAGVTVDIDGDTRPLDSGFDIGADEHQVWQKVYLPLALRNYH